MGDHLTREDIAEWRPEAFPTDDSTPLSRAEARMRAAGTWHPAQMNGRRWAIGCVALEITQRCNLDCTLCYLSEHSEAVKDIPLEEVFRRIDMIRAHYGEHCDVQVTGGDPTLRKREELVAIVRRVAERGLRPSLFTNGIRATRDLLTELAGAGLVDVAFHVDLTQQRRGYPTEAALNAVRKQYIERARGLGIQVMFNTTICNQNFHELPGLVQFFVEQADTVRLASFQLQADTGRGIDGGREAVISPATVQAQIEAGVGGPIGFGTAGVGHPSCNRYAMTLVANGRVHDLFDDAAFMSYALRKSAGHQFDRRDRRRALDALASYLVRNPSVIAAGLPWAAKKLWRMGADLAASRGEVHKLSFFIHNFMDACRLERDRIEGCVFMVATADGPLSMCLHNAKRDEMILKPIRMAAEATVARFWDPVTGSTSEAPPAPRETVAAGVRIPMKGRARQEQRAAKRGEVEGVT